MAHGMDVLVVQSFSGEFNTGDTVRVWGDTGNLCRMYTDAWAIGDTAVWSLKHTDLAGGPLEQPQDYYLSVCGTYWLQFMNGEVAGPITNEGGHDVMSLTEFASLVNGCLSIGIAETEKVDPMVIRSGAEGTSIAMNTSRRVQLTVSDAAGRVCIFRDWDGLPLPLNELPIGMYAVTVKDGNVRWVRKVVVR